jgi:hypothetical protein
LIHLKYEKKDQQGKAAFNEPFSGTTLEIVERDSIHVTDILKGIQVISLE